MSLQAQINARQSQPKLFGRTAKLPDMTGLLIALFWFAPTIRYRAEMGFFSFALVEPIALILIGFLLLRSSLKGRIAVSTDPITILFVVLLVWVSLIRPWGRNWQSLLSDVRDWGLPVLTYVVLISTVQKGWRKKALLFVLVGIVSAALGIYQHFADSFRPFASAASANKLGYFLTADPRLLPRPSVAMAFFEHPNSLAVYLTIALVIALGWIEDQRPRLPKLALAVCIFAALLWTYAKAEILVLTLILVVLVLCRYLSSVRVYVLLVSSLFGLSIIAFWIAMRLFPVAFGTFWWRVDLWRVALETLVQRPLTLLLGNGDALYASRAIWPQPHNVYIHVLLQYGLAGLGLLLVIELLIIRDGLKAYRKGWLRRYPVLRAVWGASLIFFVTGLVESALMGIETRMIFVGVVACFVGLRRELQATATTSHLPDPGS